MHNFSGRSCVTKWRILIKTCINANNNTTVLGFSTLNSHSMRKIAFDSLIISTVVPALHLSHLEMVSAHGYQHICALLTLRSYRSLCRFDKLFRLKVLRWSWLLWMFFTFVVIMIRERDNENIWMSFAQNCLVRGTLPANNRASLFLWVLQVRLHSQTCLFPSIPHDFSYYPCYLRLHRC